MKYNRVLVDLLEMWAEWEITGVEEIGYPGETVESRLAEYGAVPGSSGVATVPNYFGDKGARRAKAAIDQLPLHERCVVHCLYVFRVDPALLFFGKGRNGAVRAQEIANNAHRQLGAILNIRWKE